MLFMFVYDKIKDTPFCIGSIRFEVIHMVRLPSLVSHIDSSYQNASTIVI